MTQPARLILIGALLLGGCSVPAPSPTSGLATALPAPTATLPPSVSDQLQQLADQIVDRDTPGVILAATVDGLMYSAVAGVADITTGRAMSSSDPFRIGSVTKTFTAALVLLLQTDGVLELTDTVEEWLPGAVPDGSLISIEMLLHQTSGLFDYTDDPAVLGVYETDPSHVWKPEQLIEIATGHTPLFPPGERWAYSNTNYIILGRIVEVATGAPLHRALEERLLTPLGLRDTELATDAELPATAVHGYLLDPAGQLSDSSGIDPSEGWAAGGIVSTAADVSAFYAALLGGQVLTTEVLARMLTTVPTTDPLMSGYGLGIYERPVTCPPVVALARPPDPGTVWSHDGAIFGYQTFVFASGSGDRTLVAMVNRPERPWWLDSAAEVVFCHGLVE